MVQVMTICVTCGADDPDARKQSSAPARHFDIGAPQQTVEALMYSLRSRGAKALEESATKRRLSELSDDQVIEVGDRLQRLRAEIARAWTAAEVKTLFQARIKCPKALSMHV
jgi:cytochrome c553